MIDRGKLVILLMIGLAVGATLFAWWYHVQRGDRALLFWGREAAVLIRHARQVELLRVKPVQPGRALDRSRIVSMGGRDFVVQDRREISQAPGMVHARQALIEDASFAWDDSPSRDGCDWRFVLLFSEQDKRTTIALDLECQRVLLCEADRQVSVRPIARGLKTFIGELLPEPD